MTKRWRGIVFAIGSTVLAGCGTYQNLTPAAGTLDTSFGTNGIATASWSGTVSRLLVDPTSDKLLVIGPVDVSSTPSVVMTRLTENGAVDTSLQNVTASMPSGSTPAQLATITEAAFQASTSSDDTLLILGQTATYDSTSEDVQYVPVVNRYTASGAIDTTYGTGGSVNVTSTITGLKSGATFKAYGMAVQAGQAIIAGAFANDGKAYNSIGLIRLTSTGTADTSFGTAGIASANFHSTDVVNVNNIAIGPSNVIYVSAQSCNLSAGVDPLCALYLLRFTVNGTIDTTFTSTGAVQLAAKSTGEIALQSTGTPVLGSSFGGTSALLRLTTAGAIDTTFGSSGQLASPATHFALGTDDSIFVVWRNLNNTFDLTHFTSLGTLDTSFGNGGTIETSAPSALASPAAVVRQSNGKLVVAGVSANLNVSSLAPELMLTRYAN